MWSRGIDEVVMIPSESRETKSGDPPCSGEKGRKFVLREVIAYFSWIFHGFGTPLATRCKRRFWQAKPNQNKLNPKRGRSTRRSRKWCELVAVGSPPQLSILRLPGKCTTQFCDCLFTAVNCFEMTPFRSEGVVKWSIEDPLTIS